MSFFKILMNLSVTGLLLMGANELINSDLPANEDLKTDSPTLEYRECSATLRQAADHYQPHLLKRGVREINHHPGGFNLEAAFDLYDYLMDWTDTRPLGEGKAISLPLTTLFLQRKGSSLEYATTLVTALGAIGGTARIVIASGGGGELAYPELLIPPHVSNEALKQLLRGRYGLPPDFSPAMSEHDGQRYLNLDHTSYHPGAYYRAAHASRCAVELPGRFIYSLSS